MCSDENWKHLSRDVFVCLEQSVSCVCNISTGLSNYVTLSSVGLIAELNQKQALIGESSTELLTFVPLNILTGHLLMQVHKLSNDDKHAILHLVGRILEEVESAREDQQLSKLARSPHNPNSVPLFPIQSKLASIGLSYEDFEEEQETKYEECYKYALILCHATHNGSIKSHSHCCLLY